MQASVLSGAKQGIRQTKSWNLPINSPGRNMLAVDVKELNPTRHNAGGGPEARCEDGTVML